MPEPPPPPGYNSIAEVLKQHGLAASKFSSEKRPLPEGVVERTDIEYGRNGDKPLLLDLCAPEKIEKPVPGLIFIHGGGWERGNRKDYRPYLLEFAKMGYVATTISYRLTREAVWPACLEDAKCAVRWMRANAAELNVDPKKIVVIGGSAGGHLSMLVGFTSDSPEFEGNGGHPGVSSRVQAIVDLYGPTDLTIEGARTYPVVEKLFGKPYTEAPEAYAIASPLTHVSKDDPPTLIFQGTIDDIVPVQHSDWLAAKLAKTGVPHVYKRLEGWPHTMDITPPVFEYCLWHIKKFLDQHVPMP